MGQVVSAALAPKATCVPEKAPAAGSMSWGTGKNPPSDTGLEPLVVRTRETTDAGAI